MVSIGRRTSTVLLTATVFFVFLSGIIYLVSESKETSSSTSNSPAPKEPSKNEESTDKKERPSNTGRCPFRKREPEKNDGGGGGASCCGHKKKLVRRLRPDLGDGENDDDDDWKGAGMPVHKGYVRILQMAAARAGRMAFDGGDLNSNAMASSRSVCAPTGNGGGACKCPFLAGRGGGGGGGGAPNSDDGDFADENELEDTKLEEYPEPIAEVGDPMSSSDEEVDDDEERRKRHAQEEEDLMNGKFNFAKYWNRRSPKLFKINPQDFGGEFEDAQRRQIRLIPSPPISNSPPTPAQATDNTSPPPTAPKENRLLKFPLPKEMRLFEAPLLVFSLRNPQTDPVPSKNVLLEDVILFEVGSPEDQPKDQAQNQTEDQNKNQTGDQPEDQNKNQTEDHPEDQARNQTEDHPEDQAQNQTENHPEDQLKVQNGDRSDNQNQNENESHGETQSKTDDESKSESNSELHSEANDELQSESDGELQSESDGELQSESRDQPNPPFTKQPEDTRFRTKFDLQAMAPITEANNRKGLGSKNKDIEIPSFDGVFTFDDKTDGFIIAPAPPTDQSLEQPPGPDCSKLPFDPNSRGPPELLEILEETSKQVRDLGLLRTRILPIGFAWERQDESRKEGPETWWFLLAYGSYVRKLNPMITPMEFKKSVYHTMARPIDEIIDVKYVEISSVATPPDWKNPEPPPSPLVPPMLVNYGEHSDAVTDYYNTFIYVFHEHTHLVDEDPYSTIEVTVWGNKITGLENQPIRPGDCIMVEWRISTVHQTIPDELEYMPGETCPPKILEYMKIEQREPRLTKYAHYVLAFRTVLLPD